MYMGIEPEFMLLGRDAARQARARSMPPTRSTSPATTTRACRAPAPCSTTSRSACAAVGIDVYQIDHEDANGQFEVNFTYADALKSADNFTFVKMAASEIARKHGMIATFMPKPFSNRTGSGAHFHISLGNDKQKNLFEDKSDKRGLKLSTMAYQFLGGVLAHARALAAVCAPTVNSYKRLVVGRALSGATWAPAYVAYGDNNRTACVRIPGGRLELRLPDSGCNPYLALAAVVAAGMDGIERKLDPGEPTNLNMYELSEPQLRDKKISLLPQNLLEAIGALEKDEVVKAGLGAELAPSSSRSSAWNGPNTRAMSPTGRRSATWSSSDVWHRRTAAQEAGTARQAGRADDADARRHDQPRAGLGGRGDFRRAARATRTSCRCSGARARPTGSASQPSSTAEFEGKHRFTPDGSARGADDAARIPRR